MRTLVLVKFLIILRRDRKFGPSLNIQAPPCMSDTRRWVASCSATNSPAPMRALSPPGPPFLDSIMGRFSVSSWSVFPSRPSPSPPLTAMEFLTAFPRQASLSFLTLSSSSFIFRASSSVFMPFMAACLACSISLTNPDWSSKRFCSALFTLSKINSSISFSASSARSSEPRVSPLFIFSSCHSLSLSSSSSCFAPSSSVPRSAK
mmetsp:Transcript_6778/g.13355  ORF Transcript_6778/g.13355 Transcript_6778/m.13355 type:complete len:205 (-) Transcript_6778:421-1035(-)